MGHPDRRKNNGRNRVYSSFRFGHRLVVSLSFPNLHFVPASLSVALPRKTSTGETCSPKTFPKSLSRSLTEAPTCILFTSRYRNM